MTVYQVYGPRVGSDSATLSRIRDDFATAKTTLMEYGLEMKGWVFVHNDPLDLSHEIAFSIAALQKENPGVTIHRWAFEAIWDVIKQLSLDKLEALFGFTSPMAASMDRLEFAALVRIIEFLERAPIPANADLTKPSVKKLGFDALLPEFRSPAINNPSSNTQTTFHRLTLKTHVNHEKSLHTRAPRGPHPVEKRVLFATLFFGL